MSVYDCPAHAYMADISTPSSAWVRAPRAGRIVRGGSAIYNAITVANCGIAMYIWSAGVGTAVTAGSWTVTQSGSAAGDVDTCAPTAANYVTAGQAIEFRSDGASTTACPAMMEAIIR